MNQLKVIFMGTPEFAVPILEKIASKHEVVLVVTQPDSLAGRKRVLTYPPVKQKALELNIPIFQPHRIRDEEDFILSHEADIVITAAYGQIIGKRLLNYFPYRSINIHGSLLPKYRGGAPIQRAIINGDTETGITIMYMDQKMDAGDILRQETIAILDSDTQDSLFDKMSLLASKMILPFLDDLQKGEITPIKQDPSLVTFAYNLTKEDEVLDFNKSARQLFNQIRGLNSNPGAFTLIDNKILKIYSSEVSPKTHHTQAGLILEINKDHFLVSCGNNTTLKILEVQLEGKNKVSARDFINGVGRNLLAINKKIGGTNETKSIFF